jgi:hypothetical protein
VLRLGPADVWDPQRLSVGADVALAGWAFQPTLTAWGPATSRDTLPDLAPDLATDTGKVASGGRPWSFTLRNDVLVDLTTVSVR